MISEEEKNVEQNINEKNHAKWKEVVYISFLAYKRDPAYSHMFCTRAVLTLIATGTWLPADFGHTAYQNRSIFIYILIEKPIWPMVYLLFAVYLANAPNPYGVHVHIACLSFLWLMTNRQWKHIWATIAFRLCLTYSDGIKSRKTVCDDYIYIYVFCCCCCLFFSSSIGYFDHNK